MHAIHLNLDDAWPADTADIERMDAYAWGLQLRFSAPPALVETFFAEYAERLAPFTLYGSGDFHHLTALWLRRVREPITVVSFDNHPDWDVRPPKWCCGSWVNRALELPQVQQVSVWGCGNFECWWPGQIFGNRRAEREGKLEVHPWADTRSRKQQQRRGAILQSTWRERFAEFARGLEGSGVYVTIDMDCLTSAEAITNWENGKFTTDDVAWALEFLHASARIVAGDLCGAFSPPKYARAKQRFVADVDHPKRPLPNESKARAVNRAAFAKLWPVLTQ